MKNTNIMSREEIVSEIESEICPTEPDEMEDFETVPEPYLEPLPDSLAERTFTLVLDLDETLVHYKECGKSGKFYIRPFLNQFLKELSVYYEICIFTAAMQDYADWIINVLD